jgi:tRNA threonylcarbamoyladenosine biosynthesis protein TsaB
MPTLLSIDTSRALCSLAIHVSGRWIENTRNVERLHNQVLLGQLDDLAILAGVDRRAFDAVAFAAGPGSFTGVRIAAAVCQGIAFACGAVTIPVSSSRALAVAAAIALGAAGNDRRLLTVSRSRRDAYYLAGYRLAAGQWPSQCLSDRLHLGSDAPADLPDQDWLAAGQRPTWWPSERPFLDDPRVTAVTVGELALDALAQGRVGQPAAALPIYVAGDSPWQPAKR